MFSRSYQKILKNTLIKSPFIGSNYNKCFSSSTIYKKIYNNYAHRKESISSCYQIETKAIKNKITLNIINKLYKKNLTYLVTFTSGAGYIMSAGNNLDLLTLSSVIIGTGLASGCAGTFNQIIERKYDAQMSRTINRPLVNNSITLAQAKLIGWTSGILGISILSIYTTSLTALLGLSTILLYTHVYTPMKRISKYNTEIGAIVGAIPPIMGYTAAINNFNLLCTSEAFLLALTLFSWQMHHFMTIAWLRRRDYAKAGFIMMSLHDKDGYKTARKGLFWAATMTLLPFGAYFANITASSCAIGTVSLNLLLLYYYYQFYRKRTAISARKAMFAGFGQLFLTFILMIIFMESHEGTLVLLNYINQYLKKYFDTDITQLNHCLKGIFTEKKLKEIKKE